MAFTIPHIDQRISEIIEYKIPVVYSPNERGELPNTFDKSFIPSSIPVDAPWYVGYAKHLTKDFNMFEINDEVLFGLQFFNTIDGEIKKYDKYFKMNPDDKKLKIELTDEEKEAQITSKKFILRLEVFRQFDIVLNDTIKKYGVESITWDTQFIEATEFLKDTTKLDNFPLLKNLSTIRNIDAEVLANKIIVNNNNYKTSVGVILGTKYRKRDEIDACATNTELETIRKELIKD